jgi:hypothetical protein
VQTGEGARPCAPRGRDITQRCIFVRDQNTSSAPITADRGDAIPPRRRTCAKSRATWLTGGVRGCRFTKEPVL